MIMHYPVQVLAGSRAYGPELLLSRQTRHLMPRQRAESPKAIRRAVAQPELSPRRLLVRINRHRSG